MSDELKKLQDDVRRLELQVAALSNANIGSVLKEVQACEPPHIATVKSQRCKNCKHMRMPHKSNPHYTCELRHETVETIWTCEQYNDKKALA